MVFDLACFTWNRIYTLLTKCIWGNVRHVTSFIRGSYIIVLLKSSQTTRSYCYGAIHKWRRHFFQKFINPPFSMTPLLYNIFLKMVTSFMNGPYGGGIYKMGWNRFWSTPAPWLMWICFTRIHIPHLTHHMNQKFLL